MNNLTYAQIKQRIFDLNQQHIFTWWHILNLREKRELLLQLKKIDFDFLEVAIEKLRVDSVRGELPYLKPVEGITLKNSVLSAVKKSGLEMIKEETVGILVFAGGQGTRLGFNLPKGMYPICPVSKRSFFEFYAEKIRTLSKLHNVTIPWYIMTSQATHSTIVSFFRKFDFFGLSEENIIFLQQGMAPAIDVHGRLMMDSKNHIVENPDGHGGAVKALGNDLILDDMEHRGIKYLFIYNVDNVLVKLCDPVFIGYHLHTHSDISCKSLIKRSADETLGALVSQSGKIKIIEYSDMPSALAKKRTEEGKLDFGSGSINTYILSVNFLKKVISEGKPMPVHLVRKRISALDSSGNIHDPVQSNGFKLEMKIFDLLEYTKKISILQANRNEEFSPLKNKNGIESFNSVSHDMYRLYFNWLNDNGIYVPKSRVTAMEVTPSFAIDGDMFKEKVRVIGKKQLQDSVDKQIFRNGTIFLS